MLSSVLIKLLRASLIHIAVTEFVYNKNISVVPKKLFINLRDLPELKIKLVTAGEWNEQVEKEDKSGYTVWSLKNRRVQGRTCRRFATYCKLCLT
jgi:hypothetical protein